MNCGMKVPKLVLLKGLGMCGLVREDTPDIKLETKDMPPLSPEIQYMMDKYGRGPGRSSPGCKRCGAGGFLSKINEMDRCWIRVDRVTLSHNQDMFCFAMEAAVVWKSSSKVPLTNLLRRWDVSVEYGLKAPQSDVDCLDSMYRDGVVDVSITPLGWTDAVLSCPSGQSAVGNRRYDEALGKPRGRRVVWLLEMGHKRIKGGVQTGPLRCWPGGLCLSRSIKDMDVGEFIVPIPYVKKVKLSDAGGKLIIVSDGIWDAVSSDMAAKSCRGLPAELAARQVVKTIVQEALRTRGLKDDTTCIVVDIIPPDSAMPPPSPPRKKPSKFSLRSLFFRKKSHGSARKLSKKLSTVGIVEELFEEGSAMLSERLGNDKTCGPSTSGLFTCAVCQVDQRASEGISISCWFHIFNKLKTLGISFLIGRNPLKTSGSKFDQRTQSNRPRVGQYNSIRPLLYLIAGVSSMCAT
ncbi:probable protein phosphatase 2C 15 [Tanacetum coccineum]